MRRKSSELIFFLTAAFLYLFLVFIVPQLFSDLPRLLSAEVEAVVPAGVSALEAAKIIKNAGAVEDARALARAMSDLGIDRSLKPGRYKLLKSTPVAVARQLAKAKPEMRKIMLVPGFSSRDTAALFDDEEGGRELFVKALSIDDNFYSGVRGYLPEDADARTVFLLPETYFVTPGKKSAQEFIKTASKLWFDRIGAEIPKDTTSDDLMETAVLASLVEGEAKAADERPLLAGVFLSRLRKKMRLQSCATVIYAWEKRGIKKKALSYEDLKISSPYNTYRVKGLPPSPICVPSLESWRAALHPKKSEYLFFFAGKDGRHIFSKSYSEHLRKQKEQGL